jgi:hypothetical protein
MLTKHLIVPTSCARSSLATEGFFDASDKGMEMLSIVRGLKVYSIEKSYAVLQGRAAKLLRNRERRRARSRRRRRAGNQAAVELSSRRLGKPRVLVKYASPVRLLTIMRIDDVVMLGPPTWYAV